MGSRPAPSRPRLIGPCWRCGELGRLAVSCTKQRPMYPFDQPQVSEAADSVACMIDVSDNEREGLDPFGHKSASVNVKPLSELCKLGNAPSSGQCVNDGLIKLGNAGLGLETLKGLDLSELGKRWELEKSECHAQAMTCRVGQARLHLLEEYPTCP